MWILPVGSGFNFHRSRAISLGNDSVILKVYDSDIILNIGIIGDHITQLY